MKEHVTGYLVQKQIDRAETVNEKLNICSHYAKRQGHADCSWNLYHYVRSKPFVLRWILFAALKPWFIKHVTTVQPDFRRPFEN